MNKHNALSKWLHSIPLSTTEGDCFRRCGCN